MISRTPSTNLAEIRREGARMAWSERFDRENLFLLVVALVAAAGLGVAAVAAFQKAPGFALFCAASGLLFAGLAAFMACFRRGWEIDGDERVVRTWQSRLGRVMEEVYSFDAFEVVELWKQGGVVGGLTIARTSIGLAGASTRVVLAATARAAEVDHLASDVSKLTGLPVRELEP